MSQNIACFSFGKGTYNHKLSKKLEELDADKDYERVMCQAEIAEAYGQGSKQLNSQTGFHSLTTLEVCKKLGEKGVKETDILGHPEHVNRIEKACVSEGINVEKVFTGPKAWPRDDKQLWVRNKYLWKLWNGAANLRLFLI